MDTKRKPFHKEKKNMLTQPRMKMEIKKISIIREY